MNWKINNLTISVQKLTDLANEIPQLFSSECASTYFIPYKKVENSVQQNRGNYIHNIK